MAALRFDDTLDTVLAGDLSSELGARSAWRQLVDLIGRRRVEADDRALGILARIRPSVPPPVRAASARALLGTRPPLPLVRLFVGDDIAIGSALLRAVALDEGEWLALLPELSPAGRAVLRNRADLPDAVVRALAAFGSVDFVLGDEAAPLARPLAPSEPQADLPAGDLLAEPAPPPVPPEPSPFARFGEIARDLPVVAEAMRREKGEPAPPSLFRISDVVARIEAFQRRRESHPPTLAPVPVERPGELRFETDADGVIRWAEGVPRGAIVGMSLARIAPPGGAGVDGVAAGAYRQRARFADANLVLGTGEGWRISAIPAFDEASGRFTGYRGTGRRPRAADAPGRAATPTADSLRQLVHELRTPTNAIAGFAEMIEHQMLGPVSETYRGHAATILAQARSLLAAIDDLDIAARIEARALPQHPAAVAMRPLLERLVAEAQPIAEERRATITLGNADAIVMGDARAVERLVARLLLTVAALGSRGERIGVKARPRDGGIVAIAIDRPDALSGIGADALFDLDDEVASGALLGTGFALRLVRNLAAELGGTLTIGEHRLTLRLPDAVDRAMEKARTS